MRSKIHSLVCLIILLLVSFCTAAGAQTLTISGDPLEIHSNQYGVMGIYQKTEAGLQRQYFGGNLGTGSVLYLEGESGSSTYVDNNPYLVYQGTLFTPVSHVQPDGSTIVTAMDAGSSGLRVTLTIFYKDGDAYYRKVWEISNTGNTTFQNLRFLHGGDTYFAGYDYSEGHWDPTLKMVYLTNQTMSVTGIMGFYGGSTSPADGYYEDRYSDVWTAMANASLPNRIYEIDPIFPDPYHDSGYALQWNKATLGPGQVWRIEAFEKWTNAGMVQVVAPLDQDASPGQVLDYSFTVSNYSISTSESSFNLEVSSSNGWEVNLVGEPSLVIPPGGSESVKVQVTVPENAVFGDVDKLKLTATSSIDPSITNSDEVSTRVGRTLEYTLLGDVNGSGGIDVGDYHLISVPGAVPINGDAFAVYGPGAEYPDGLRIFQYKNGANVEYLTGTGNPVSPVSPGQGYWVISRETRQLSIDSFPLAPSGDPVSVTLTPGWNIVGYPYSSAMPLSRVRVDGFPIGSQSPTVLVENQAWGYHASYFPVLDGTLGDLGLEPWNAYWFKNVSSRDVTLTFPMPSTGETSGRVGKTISPAPFRRGLAFTVAEKGKEYKDKTLFLGVHPKAANGADHLDASAPPGLSGQFPKIYVDHGNWTKRGGKYAVDIRRQGIYPQVYNLVIQVPARSRQARYVLKWKGLDTLPAGRGAYMKDALAGRSFNMRNWKQYEIIVPKATKAYKLQVIIK
ncbi:MAG: hypothetical protein AB9866_02445 [Syntrophobacteraceae bacterium]